MRTPQGETKFVLTDPAAQKTSEWIAVGGNFAGYRVTGFEAKSEMLAVERDGETRQLRLKNAAVAMPAGASAGEAREMATTAQQEMLASQRVMMLEFMAKEHESLRQMVSRLRETLPAGDPHLLKMEDTLAKSAQTNERNAAQLDHAKRIMLLKKIRELGDSDEQQLVALQAAVRELDIRLARQRAEMPAAAAR